MRNTLYIVFFGILVYLGLSTIIADSAIIGTYGHSFAIMNHKYFGYLSYIYLFALLYPLYRMHQYSVFTSRRLELTLASILVFFALEIIQTIIVSNSFKGKLSTDFVAFLSPYIGLFGVWVFVIVLLSISLSILFEDEFSELKERWMSSRKIEKDMSEESEEIINDDITTYPEEDFELEQPAYMRRESAVDDFSIKVIKKNEKEINAKEESPKIVEDISQTQVDSEKNIVSIAKKVKEQKHGIIVDELEENKKLLDSIEKGKVEKPKNFKLPSVDFLQKPPKKSNTVDEAELDDKIKDLIEKLAHFNIDGDVIRTYAGPVVSTFEFKPAANVKVSKILNLQDDLAMALRAETIRIQAPIPGKDVVGIEIPNRTVETIYLRDLIQSDLFMHSKSPLTIVLGKDIVGKPFITDLKKLPHLLIAGTTGSGKSVGINSMILSLLYKNSPDQLRFLMIDPKMLEFSIYNDIPHLLTPVITKAKQAVVALNNMVSEMERRYMMMSDTRTKNIENYNEKIVKEGGKELPYIVVIIDELADLMMTSGKEVEHSIARLAQMARAAGIHLIVATQRPSVDVVTGLIKANLPSRISYRVGQKVDSKIILDQQGAESLLGRGDMLFTPPGSTGLVRLHAPWSTEEEIEKIVDFVKSQREPEYDKSFLLEESESAKSGGGELYEELDPLYEEAKNIILTDKKTSISYLQRKLQIGYNKSARLIEQLEQSGVLSEPNTRGIREIL